MRDVNYTIIERRIRRLERLIANERLDQKNEFLGLGKKKPTEDSIELVLSILEKEYPQFADWKKRRMSSGWKNYSGKDNISLEFDVNNGVRGNNRISYDVTLAGKDLKKIKLMITRHFKNEDKETILNKAVSLVKPDQIRKAFDTILDSIDQREIEDW